MKQGGGMKRFFSALAFSFLVLALFSCSRQSDSTTMRKEDLKVGFIFPGAVDAGGYNKSLAVGKEALDFAGIRTFYVENVPPDRSCINAMEDLIELGCNVIYSTSGAYFPCISELSEKYPEIKFAVTDGKPNGKNLSVYNGRTYEGMYLSGITAGMRTATNKIAYIAAFPSSDCIRDINAFTLGVQSVNPDAVVNVEWTFKWGNSVVDKIRARDLIKKGCDVISSHTDSTAASEVIEEYGAYYIPSMSESENIPKKIFLTSPVINWSVFFLDDIDRIINKNWESRFYWCGIKEGMVDIEPLGENCVPGSGKKVSSAKSNLEKDSRCIFRGPVYDQNGNLRIKAGDSLNDDEIWNMNWFVKGIKGYIPKD